MVKMEDKLDKLLISTAEIKVKLESLEQDINIINKRLFVGNGQASITTTLAAHTEQLKELKWHKRAAVAAFTSGAGALILALLERLT